MSTTKTAVPNEKTIRFYNAIGSKATTTWMAYYGTNPSPVHFVLLFGKPDEDPIPIASTGHEDIRAHQATQEAIADAWNRVCKYKDRLGAVRELGGDYAGYFLCLVVPHGHMPRVVSDDIMGSCVGEAMEHPLPRD